MAVMRLSAVLYALAALVQVSQAIHFTNQQWDVHDNETFLFEWAYDYTDPDPDTFLTMITLLAYDVEFPWSNNYSNLIFNGMPPFYRA